MPRPVRFLHTADWHLGQSLLGQSRLAEQARALDWVYEQLHAREADGLIVAGDVFDVASPAEDARKLYYDFLARVAATPQVKWTVVVAGNHDSPRMLGNIRELAGALGVHVIGAPAEEQRCVDDLLELRFPDDGELAAVVAAVPFLHGRWLRRSQAGQAAAERELAVARGIHGHFDRLAGHAAGHAGRVPLLATGHLYATGSQAREGQDNIYVGNVRNLDAARLPTAFDYVALGHIHRPQALPGSEHVRYSGSLIPLDFQESVDEKGLWCVSFGHPGCEGCEPDVAWVPSPVTRRLKQLEGDRAELREAIARFGERHRDDELEAWLELRIVGGADEATRTELRELASGYGARVLKMTRLRRATAEATAERRPAAELERLEELSVEDVFARRCGAAELEPDVLARLQPLFREAREAVAVGAKTEAA